jgi:hypothetical protein
MSVAKRISAAASALLLLGVVAPAPAFAGERAGNGEAVTVNAKSDCAYSGLEDFDFEADAQPGVVQNWGQFPQEFRAFLTSIGVDPGSLCNAHLNPIK